MPTFILQLLFIYQKTAPAPQSASNRHLRTVSVSASSQCPPWIYNDAPPSININDKENIWESREASK